MKQISLKFIPPPIKQSVLTLAAVGTLSLTGGRASAQAAPNRYPITPDLVITAMSARQLATEGVNVKLAAPITSLSSNPTLVIEAIARTAKLEAQLRVACQTKRECLPFYVSATWPQTSGPNVLADLSQTAEVKGRAGEAPLTSKAGREVSTAPIMRSGTPATLLFEDQKIHIRLQVVCLEDGATGAKIRVATPDHKQSYRAEVLAPNLLKGTF